jgi:molecular chaperone GrpE
MNKKNESSKKESEPLKEEKKSASDYLEQLQRLQAEFINYRHRVEKEKLDIMDRTRNIVLVKFLEIKDNFDRAPKLDEGMQLIYNLFTKIFEEEQIKEVKYNKFDPELHEAIATDNTTDKDKIKEVFTKGYTRRDKIMRPAKVVVGTKE